VGVSPARPHDYFHPMKTALTLPNTPRSIATSTQPRPWRRLAWGAWIIVAIVTAIVFVQPVRSAMIHLQIVAGITMLWVGAVALVPNKAFRIAGIVLPAIAGSFLLLPGKTVDEGRLRAGYAEALKRYEGTPYIWGGESRRGIDCSGLIRCSLIDAQWRQGIATANPALLRDALKLAWNDTSAKAMQNEHRGQTRLLFKAKHLGKIDTSKLLPGDFAVTAGGIHTLAYLGEGMWIEAEPSEKVMTLPAKADRPWMLSTVSVMRWTRLDGGAARKP